VHAVAGVLIESAERGLETLSDVPLAKGGNDVLEALTSKWVRRGMVDFAKFGLAWLEHRRDHTVEVEARACLTPHQPIDRARVEPFDSGGPQELGSAPHPLLQHGSRALRAAGNLVGARLWIHREVCQKLLGDVTLERRANVTVEVGQTSLRAIGISERLEPRLEGKLSLEDELRPERPPSLGRVEADDCTVDADRRRLCGAHHDDGRRETG
jgi:hypothetical protein